MKEDLQTNLIANKDFAAIGVSYGRFFILCVVLALISCESKDLKQAESYEGPIRVIMDENTMMTDSGKALIRIRSAQKITFKSGDEEWPEGLNLEIYRKDGKTKQSTFRSDEAEYSSEEDVYRGIGNVVVQNFDTKDELNTEELFWDPNKEIFYTEKFVTIVSDGEIHTGNGLTADQNFETYTIHDPKGSLTIEDDPK